MAHSSDLTECIERGDRKALAAFVLQHRSRIMRRLRGKLRYGDATTIDEEDIFSSCARRLDLMCTHRQLQCMSENELVNYILRMAMNITMNRIRAEHRRSRTLHRFWRESLSQSHNSYVEPDQRMIDSLMRQLHEDDRHMLQLRLDGLTHTQIAHILDISISAERSRWQRLRMKAKSLLAPPRDC